ncbi:hypothetical protein BaRGS_00012413 [Batillaria attramentaria]|uniref:Uncharacterized protein n=1 Tax=Batillaria attramentaria TaxID=370345 RepID=A0ABD0LAL6_9CAEN
MNRPRRRQQIQGTKRVLIVPDVINRASVGGGERSWPRYIDRPLPVEAWRGVIAEENNNIGPEAHLLDISGLALARLLTHFVWQQIQFVLIHAHLKITTPSSPPLSRFHVQGDNSEDNDRVAALACPAPAPTRSRSWEEGGKRSR